MLLLLLCFATAPALGLVRVCGRGRGGGGGGCWRGVWCWGSGMGGLDQGSLSATGGRDEKAVCLVVKEAHKVAALENLSKSGARHIEWSKEAHTHAGCPALVADEGDLWREHRGLCSQEAGGLWRGWRACTSRGCSSDSGARGWGGEGPLRVDRGMSPLCGLWRLLCFRAAWPAGLVVRSANGLCSGCGGAVVLWPGAAPCTGGRGGGALKDNLIVKEDLVTDGAHLEPGQEAEVAGVAAGAVEGDDEGAINGLCASCQGSVCAAVHDSHDIAVFQGRPGLCVGDRFDLEDARLLKVWHACSWGHGGGACSWRAGGKRGRVVIALRAGALGSGGLVHCNFCRGEEVDADVPLYILHKQRHKVTVAQELATVPGRQIKHVPGLIVCAHARVCVCLYVCVSVVVFARSFECWLGDYVLLRRWKSLLVNCLTAAELHTHALCVCAGLKQGVDRLRMS